MLLVAKVVTLTCMFAGILGTCAVLVVAVSVNFDIIERDTARLFFGIAFGTLGCFFVAILGASTVSLLGG